jgi:hypothetical protein
MPLDSIQLRSQVDKFISALDEEDFAAKNPEGSAVIIGSVGQMLQRKNSGSDPDEYDQFSEALAKDPRFQKKLPFIAMDLLVDSWQSGRHLLFSEDGELQSKSGAVPGAINKEKYDAVHRAAVKYLADNFDKYRGFDKADDFTGFGNAWKITSKDITAGTKAFRDYRMADVAIAANQKLLNEFDKIDRNGDGAINLPETSSWLAESFDIRACRALDRPTRYVPYRDVNMIGCAFLVKLYEAAPQETDRMLPSSQKLTRQNLSSRIDELSTKKSQFEEQWGLKPKEN